MPVYNDAPYLNEAIDSILDQSFSNFEFIIINDGSTDNSLEIIKSYRDKRIILIQNEKNQGIAKTLNLGMEHVKGEYVARMDGNDVAYIERFELQNEILDNNRNIGLVTCHSKVVNDEGEFLYNHIKEISPNLSQISIFFKNYIAHSTVMIKRSIMHNPVYDINCAAEDYDLWIKLASSTQFYIVPKILMKIRLKKDGLNKLNKTNMIKAHKNIISTKLNELQICPTDWEIDFHYNFAKKPLYDTKEAYLILRYLGRLYKGNKKFRKFKEPDFSEILSNHWSHILKKVEKTDLLLICRLFFSPFHDSKSLIPTFKIILKLINRTLKYHKIARNGNYKINLDDEKWELISKGFGHVDSNSKNYLNEYEKNIFSQNGEDGVLAKIIDQLGTINKYYVEFGGWDGERYSNTCNLGKYHGWKGVLFENDYKKVKIGRKKGIKNIFLRTITPNNINKIFKNFNVPYNFGLLSIDIDGDDYWVWKSLTNYRPVIVILETHPAIPNKYPLSIIYGKSDPDYGYFGANLNAMARLADRKGYYFATTVAHNAIFVNKEYFYRLQLPILSLDEIINNYFEINKYWYNNRDLQNRSWLNLDELY